MVGLEIHSRNQVVSRWWRPSTSVFLGRVETSNNEMVWQISRTKHFRQHEHFTKNSKIRWTTMWVDREISLNINRCHHTVTLRATKSQWTHKITMVFEAECWAVDSPNLRKGCFAFWPKTLIFFTHVQRFPESFESLELGHVVHLGRSRLWGKIRVDSVEKINGPTPIFPWKL